MAHPASRRFSYPAQFGILLVFLACGLMLGGLLSFLPLLKLVSFSDLFSTDSTKLIDRLLVPANASVFRTIQFLSTLFIFFMPAVAYAWLCHRKPQQHLGLSKRPALAELALVILLMLAAMPVVGSLQEFSSQLPWSDSLLKEFQEAERAYNKQVSVIARMDSIPDLLLALGMIAALPAIFEELLFRGALQNLLTRWTKKPILAIGLTAILFSAVHGSMLGFLSRVLLGILLGWVFYRSGKLWISILGHFVNNAVAILTLYATRQAGKPLDPSKIDTHFPWWVGGIGLVAVLSMIAIFDRYQREPAPTAATLEPSLDEPPATTPISN